MGRVLFFALVLAACVAEAGSGGGQKKPKRDAESPDTEQAAKDLGISIEDEKLIKVVSPVFEQAGTPEDLAKRGKACIAQLVSNDAVQISDTSNGGFIGGPGLGKSNSISGGDVIVAEDLPGGMVTANSRVGHSSMMIRYNFSSTLQFQAKDDRFRISHTNIQRVMLSTGNATNNGYSQVCTNWGCGHETVAEALQQLSSKIAACVAKPPENEEW